eukprot:1156000-Pelagomonas_calceolata.AAC.2
MRTFLEQDLNPLDYFLSEIMDIYFVAGSDKQAEQSNHLAEGLQPGTLAAWHKVACICVLSCAISPTQLSPDFLFS